MNNILPKSTCRKLAPITWNYSGFDGKHYIFQSGNYDSGFMEFKCLPEDMEEKNLALMAKMGITRV